MRNIPYRTAISSIAGRACLLFAAAVLLPLSVAAQCGTWDVSGDWSIVLGNNGPRESLHSLTQSGTGVVSGMARLTITLDPTNGNGGKVAGQLDGDKFSLNITWTELGRVNEVTIIESFNGTIGSDGVIKGKGFISALAGGVQIDWSSSRPMKCLFTPVHHMRVVHHGNAGGSVEPAPAPLQVPGIVASPNNIALPAGQTSGTTTLTWDGGKDHPYAEIWVRVDDQDETKVLEQGKGTLDVTVIPGKTYLYILTDAGVTLATVTVQFHR